MQSVIELSVALVSAFALAMVSQLGGDAGRDPARDAESVVARVEQAKAPASSIGPGCPQAHTTPVDLTLVWV